MVRTDREELAILLYLVRLAKCLLESPIFILWGGVPRKISVPGDIHKKIKKKKRLDFEHLRDAQERRDTASVVLRARGRPAAGDGVVMRAHQDVPVPGGPRDLRDEVHPLAVGLEHRHVDGLLNLKRPAAKDPEREEIPNPNSEVHTPTLMYALISRVSFESTSSSSFVRQKRG